MLGAEKQRGPKQSFAGMGTEATKLSGNRATQSAGCEGQEPCWADTGGAHSARICHVQHCDVSLASGRTQKRFLHHYAPSAGNTLVQASLPYWLMRLSEEMVALLCHRHRPCLGFGIDLDLV